MKRTRKKAKKPAKKTTWGDKLDQSWSWTKGVSSRMWNKLMGTAVDDEFPLALGLMLTGGAIMVGCLDPWLLIGALGVLVGGHKLYHILKWH